MEDLTKELWQGVSERLDQPEPVYQPPLLVAEPPLPVADRTSWRVLVSRTMAAILALGCALGLIAIINAGPFASTSVAERVSDKLGQPATCVQHAATVTADHPQTIYRCIVGSKTQGAAQCFAVSGREIQQLGGRRDLRC